MENQKRKIEVFSAGCACCEETIALAERAKHLGIRSVPAVAVDGKLAGCCARRGPDEHALRAAGLGVPVS
jgi:glutaredoxin 3